MIFFRDHGWVCSGFLTAGEELQTNNIDDCEND